MTHRTLATATLAVLLPLTALALDYRPSVSSYRDASSFTTAERAGIGLLTSIGVVQGNPTGRFEARRTINRAEFTKIAMRLLARHRQVVQGFTPGCFPDVPRDSWFEADVCTAKALGVVRGNPDGLFHPERSVNYAEALKILAEAYALELGPTDPLVLEAWYQTYVRVAAREKLALSGTQPADALTRGQMARLAAAFEAHAAGELDLYRQAERGELPSASSSSSAVSSASSSFSSSASSASSVSSSSSVSSIADFPVRSHILLLGQLSPAVAGASFFSEQEPVRVRGARMTLRNEVKSIDRLELIDQDGRLIGLLSKDGNDATNKTWRGTYALEGAYEIPKSQSRILGVRARLKPRDGGGESEELLWVDTVSLTLQGVWSESSIDAALQTGVSPKHQTAQARLLSARNAADATGALPLGSDQVLAAFAFSGAALSPASLDLEELQFSVTKADQVTVSNWQLGAADTATRVTCSANGSTVTCAAIPAELGRLQNGQRTLRLHGTVSATGGGGRFLQVSLVAPGTVGEIGAVRWTDGTGHFTWVDLPSPLASGTRWE